MLNLKKNILKKNNILLIFTLFHEYNFNLVIFKTNSSHKTRQSENIHQKEI